MEVTLDGDFYGAAPGTAFSRAAGSFNHVSQPTFSRVFAWLKPPWVALA